MRQKVENCLLIDIGNTNTHVSYSSGKRFHGDTEFSTNSNITISLQNFIKGRPVDLAVIASVVPKKNKAFAQALKKMRIFNVHFVDSRSPLTISIDYPNPQTIGADRLVNSEGAVIHYGAPVIVIDFGTAVTFDVVNKNKQYIGGVIAPGLAAMTDYLYQRTALLPKISLKEPQSIIGKNTIDAMMIGAVIGYRGLINEILQKILKEDNMQNAIIISTGGYSRLISRKIPEISFVDIQLTMKGLKSIKDHLVRVS